MSPSIQTLMVATLLGVLSPPAFGQPDQGYLGAKACAECHRSIHAQWKNSLHSKIMQPATGRTVEGDFAQGTIRLHGATYRLEQRAGHYYISESDLTGKPWEHEVDYTLGSRRVQHYLTRMSDGRIIILLPTWDNLAKKWIHDIDTQNSEEDPSAQIQIWNKTCYSCHVSREQKNFDVQELRYRTTWQDFGVNCERCHGPGREHVAKAAESVHTKATVTLKGTIVNPSRLDAARSTMICAQCHSFRDIYVDGFNAGANYYDFFLPVMEYRLPNSQDPAFWADGRPRWFSNEAVAFWQSQCFLKGGATCTSCHSRAHDINIDSNPQLQATNAALCTRCHTVIGARISAHTHHPPGSSGSSCVECHMPSTVIGINAHFRDHSIGIPVPENSIQYGIPNACNLCHKDKDLQWTLRQMNAWYGGKSRQEFIRRADAFATARKGDNSSIPALLQILSDRREGSYLRANAAGYLAGFPNDPSAYDAVVQAFSDPDPLVRATAGFDVRPRAAQREAVAPELAALLADPVRTVRMSAAIALAAKGVRLYGEDGERFASAKELYRSRSELNSDDPQQQFAAGGFFFLVRDVDAAVAAFRASLKLDPTLPAKYPLAKALAEKGAFPEARQVLQTISPDEPQYNSAQQLLTSLDARDVNRAGTSERTIPPENIEARTSFLDGQSQYRNENYGAALNELDHALRLAPSADWATKAQIFRAICLEKLARTEEAEAAIKALSASPEGRSDVELQLAYAELLYETGHAEEALEPIDVAVAADTKSPTAYFWRAKVLLQLRRIDEAGAAARESIRLFPDSPLAHNLLIRIYQIQGRANEAAQEAEWLREYQRRIESR
jgi:predicted CXXCH cytochrome family protein